jgi:hypothetical protein
MSTHFVVELMFSLKYVSGKAQPRKRRWRSGILKMLRTSIGKSLRL